ncbi:MAG: sugar phosphate isomerase/epimerase family protein [Bacteroidales bacterium]
MKISRRRFIQATALTGAFMTYTDLISLMPMDNKKQNQKIFFFSKPLDKYETEFMSETLSMAGIDGFDLTVRPGGKVTPEKVTDDLPKVIETFNKYNLDTHLIVTAITGTEDPVTEKILKTASGHGVKHYRLGYYDYDMSAGVLKSLDLIKSRMKALSDMNNHYNIQAGYQNHDGARLGAPLWDVWEVIKNLPDNSVSIQYDVRHAIVEGYRSWIIALNLIQSRIGSLAFKDFSWDIQNGRARPIHVPLGEGLVDFNNYIKILRDLNIEAPFTLHIEYPLLTAEEEGLTLLAKQKIIVEKLKKEVQFIRNIIS